MNEVTTIGPECFTDGEVICYKGENYTRQPRTITTVEELEALLNGDANVVLLDEDGISLQNLAGGWQSATGSRRLMNSDLTFHCFGPTFTVLHEEVSQ